MAPLVRFLLVNLLGGFSIGFVTGLSFIHLQMGAGLLVDEPIAAAMLLWNFAASFAMGAIATALALLSYD